MATMLSLNLNGVINVRRESHIIIQLPSHSTFAVDGGFIRQKYKKKLLFQVYGKAVILLDTNNFNSNDFVAK